MVSCEITLFILASVVLENAKAVDTIITREASMVDSVAVKTRNSRYDCMFSCKLDQSIRLDSDNSTVKCVQNRQMVALHKCKLDINNFFTTIVDYMLTFSFPNLSGVDIISKNLW